MRSARVCAPSTISSSSRDEGEQSDPDAVLYSFVQMPCAPHTATPPPPRSLGEPCRESCLGAKQALPSLQGFLISQSS